MTTDQADTHGWLEQQHECPKCEGELIAGSLFVRATFLGAVFAGFSRQHCWFKPNEDGSKERVVHTPEGFVSETIGTRSRPRAKRCKNCGLVIFEPKV
jgi:hypothetical protein